jgi:RNA polymerase sigma-70 factor (ECF subfamily)
MKLPLFHSTQKEPSTPDPFSATSINPPRLALIRLLQLCLQSADESLWSQFVHRTQPIIAGVIVKTLRRWWSASPSLVDDLVQETYLKLCANDFKALRELECENEYALYGFLKVVASNVVYDHCRGSCSQKRGCGREEQDLERACTTYADAGRSASRIERQILLQEISECLEARAAGPNLARDCAIFWLYYAQGYTAKAISELPSINLTVKGVESTILRLTRLVREGLTGKTSSSDDD